MTEAFWTAAVTLLWVVTVAALVPAAIADSARLAWVRRIWEWIAGRMQAGMGWTEDKVKGRKHGKNQ